MEDNDRLFTKLHEFIDGVQDDFAINAEYNIQLKKNMLIIEADFYEGSIARTSNYRLRLNPEQKAEVKTNLADSQENLEAWYFPNPRLYLEKLLGSSLRKEIIDNLLPML